MSNPKSQQGIMEETRADSAQANDLFLEIMRGPAPITREEWVKMNAKHPLLWGRYSRWFST